MKTYAVDFETYYDHDLSVTISGAVNYSRDAHIYGVSIFGPEVSYVGAVEEAPWPSISGHHWVSHNAGFDQAVFAAAFAKGQIPSLDTFCLDDGEWDCTADMCSYFGLGRSLKDCVKSKYGQEISKSARDKAKGKRWPEDFSPEDRDEMMAYALADAQWCWKLWNDLGAAWPVKEVELSRVTRKRCLEGVCVDLAALVHGSEALSQTMDEARRGIPWSSEGVILSHPRVKKYCEEAGIPAPESLAEKSEECSKWEAEYGDKHPVVSHIRTYRKANLMRTKLEKMEARVMENGRMYFGLKYFGAHTGRWAGAEGVNMQNLPRDPSFGVDIRSMLIAAPGKKFVVCDLAQIEPRVAAVIVGDTEMIAAMKEGFGIYEAFAKSTGVWDGAAGTLKTHDKELYALNKAQVLALGYGCGPDKFIVMAKLYCDMVLSLAQSQPIVAGYRSKNRLITGMWERLERGMRTSASRKEDHEIELPSGRVLRYSDVVFAGGLMARTGYTGPRRRFWGGTLFENVVQATARDILAEGILRLEAADIPVIFSAHDEVVCEVDDSFEGSFIKLMMTEPPDWMPGIPLEAEFVESKHYLK